MKKYIFILSLILLIPVHKINAYCPSGYVLANDGYCYKCEENQYLGTDYKCHCNVNYYVNSSTNKCQYDAYMNEKLSLIEKNIKNLGSIQDQKSKFDSLYNNINPECSSYIKPSLDSYVNKSNITTNFNNNNSACLDNLWCSDIVVFRQYSVYLEDQKNSMTILNQDTERCRNEKGTLDDYNKKVTSLKNDIQESQRRLEVIDKIKINIEKSQQFDIDLSSKYTQYARNKCLGLFILKPTEEMAITKDIDKELVITENIINIYESYSFKQCLIDNSCPLNSNYNSFDDSCSCINGYGFNTDKTVCNKIDIKADALKTEKDLSTKTDKALQTRLVGYFLSQNENNSKIWYINPKDKKRYYISNSEDLKNIISKNSITLKNSTISYYIKTKFPSTYYGKFIIDSNNKDIYYINPKTKKSILFNKEYLDNIKNIGRVALGITNKDIRKIPTE